MKLRQPIPGAAAKADSARPPPTASNRDPRLPTKTGSQERRPTRSLRRFSRQKSSHVEGSPRPSGGRHFRGDEPASPRTRRAIRRTLERRIRAGGRFTAPDRRSSSARSTRPAGWACRISPTWATRRLHRRRNPLITASTISCLPSRASNTPMSSSAARASSRSPKACKTPSGPSAAPSNIAATASRPPSATSTPPQGRI